MNILEQKRPNPKPPDESSLERNCYEITLPYHPTTSLDEIDSTTIKRSAMKTYGLHFKLGIECRQMAQDPDHLQNSSNEIHKRIASLTRKKQPLQFKPTWHHSPPADSYHRIKTQASGLSGSGKSYEGLLADR